MKAAFFIIVVLTAGAFAGLIHGTVNFVFADDAAAGGIDPLVIHELTHDMRHAAGFPCH